jgi:LmbE family N-acetylglucosaminyl deacetylase
MSKPPRVPQGYDVDSLPEPIERQGPPAGRVLCFAPHPDDEVIGPGGVLCMHRRQGDPVRVVLATDGVSGDPDGAFSADGYAELRRDESRRGLAELGVDDVGFWGYPDACIVTDADLEALADRAVDELRRFRPDVVYLPWEGESNSDHRALHLGVLRGLVQVEFTGFALGFEVWTPMPPDLLIDITAVADAKRRAIHAYRSQLHYVDYEHVIFGLHAYRSLQFRRGRGFSEAFRIVAGDAEALR